MDNKIISSLEIRNIEKAIQEGKKEVEISLDLGFSGNKESVGLFDEGIILDQKEIKLPEIREDDKSCYLLNGDSFEKIQYFNGNGIYKLIPTMGKPLLQISGTSMHKKDFVERIEKERFWGKVLDAGTGLGYTAIAAARTAKEVITIELDKQVVELSKLNPYSQGLFENKKIKRIEGDLTQEIINFKDNSFDAIILDGGTPKSSGEFFSKKNYENVARVLKGHSKLYHYIPKYHIKRGIDFAGNIEKTLSKFGVKKLERNEEGSYTIFEKK